jgi:hypothetical protein
MLNLAIEVKTDSDGNAIVSDGTHTGIDQDGNEVTIKKGQVVKDFVWTLSDYAYDGNEVKTVTTYNSDSARKKDTIRSITHYTNRLVKNNERPATYNSEYEGLRLTSYTEDANGNIIAKGCENQYTGRKLDWSLDPVSSKITEETTYNKNNLREASWDMTPDAAGHASRQIASVTEYADSNCAIAKARHVAKRDEDGKIVLTDVIHNDKYGNAAIGYQTDNVKIFRDFRASIPSAKAGLTWENAVADVGDGGLVPLFREDKGDGDYQVTEGDISWLQGELAEDHQTIGHARDRMTKLSLESVRANRNLKNFIKREEGIDIDDDEALQGWINYFIEIGLGNIYDVMVDKDLY